MEEGAKIQRLGDQIERLISDAVSEKETRKETNARIFSLLEGIDITLRGKDGMNGIMSRVKVLEMAFQEQKSQISLSEKRNFNKFNRWVSVLSLLVALAAMLAAFKTLKQGI